MVRVAEGMVTVELGEATAAVATLVGAAERGLARLIGDPGRAPSPVSGDPSRETAPLGGSPKLGIARLGGGSGPEVTRVGGRRGAGPAQPRRGPAWVGTPEGAWRDALGPRWEVERITVRLARLEPDSGQQLGLFAVDPGRRRELDAALATIRRRFGETAVRRVPGVRC